ncbi:hypothetical protein Bca52824_058388 [Brassica carinata]|uniref:Uncharacterized protein n=1 Tax=Brassica carinata TaxID=52824 RepID=A0A8X7QU71_BRACI|nr:hypothetical protein Bca52824_058388 [Brassica carinata]
MLLWRSNSKTEGETKCYRGETVKLDAETKLKSAVQLQDILDATRMLVPRTRPSRESDSDPEDLEHAEKLRQIKAVIEEI